MAQKQLKVKARICCCQSGKEKYIKMSGYKEYREKVLSDADIKAEYDALGPEYDLLQAVINAKTNQTVIQKESSGSTGIAKEEI